jgi:hypothetical protein
MVLGRAIEAYGDGTRHVKKTGGTTKPTTSPSATEKEIPSTTAEFPNLFARAFTSSMAALHVQPDQLCLENHPNCRMIPWFSATPPVDRKRLIWLTVDKSLSLQELPSRNSREKLPVVVLGRGSNFDDFQP